MDHRVALLNTVFALDDTGCVTCGGGERYLIELCGLLRELDYDPQVWQPGTKTHEIEGIRVAGLPWGGMEYGTLPELNKQFRERTAGYDKFIYFVPVLAFPHVRPCSVVISHSVFWDSPLQPWTAHGGPVREEWLRRLHQAVTAPDLFVSVDTNALNWIRALWPGYEDRQVYIPSFVETGLFHPAEQSPDRQKTVILFPRRLEWNRGLDAAKAAALVLTQRFATVEFHFVGQGAGAVTEDEMRHWAEAHPRCRYYWAPMREMPEVYRRADMVILPTQCSEGTSLSCLEAMASGKAVVCTRVGGLTDLVIDGYNGRLIEATPEALIAAIDDLFRHPDQRARLGAKAAETAQCFSLKKWRRRWAHALSTIWGDLHAVDPL